MRTPISLVRCATTYDMTPYSPEAVSTSATNANAETSTKFKRRGATESPIRSPIGRTGPIGSCGSMLATDVRRSGAIDVGVEPFVPGVADDADDFAPIARGALTDALPDRVLVRPVPARCRLVDDDDVALTTPCRGP